MVYLIDMLHHNPGEEPFDTAFSNPDHLLKYGFNGQAFKHINTVATLESLASGVFPANEDERQWLDSFTREREKEIRDAKAAGLKVYYHVDLFVLPKAIVEQFKEDILDPKTGRISLNRPKTLEIHRALFDEIFTRFPDIDGLIIRVGETYLFDTPFHTGNGAVHYHPDRPIEDKQEDFIKLLHFLREEICVRHDRVLIHRTWDTWPNRFHANRDFYLKVTDAVEPHPKFVFSIKHTQVDFHRWVPLNPCLTEGRHPQVIEVQCQREYEGKGAYPNYAIKGVIDGFSEPISRKGIREIINHPLVQGVYTWSRGGGWFGPYIKRRNELWCDLNAYVIASFFRDPDQSEEAIFHSYAREVLHLSTMDTRLFREIALLSLGAVVKGKCCAAFDRDQSNRVSYPTNQWMRDDVLHGFERLGPVFDYLAGNGLIQEAFEEKEASIALWKEMRQLCDTFSDDIEPALREEITTSVEYGLRLFSAITAAWKALLAGRQNPTDPVLADLIADFHEAWNHYQKLPQEYSGAATLYRPHGWHWPNEPKSPGLEASIKSLIAD